MKRGRKADEVKSELIKIQGRRKRGTSKRYDKTFAYLDSLQPGRRFEFVWELLTSAVNGELGKIMQEAVEEVNLDKAKEAARKIASNFVDMDE
jgi:hypothetical protein